jgi:5-methylcytosine-specific restriction endonuclease McrA
LSKVDDYRNTSDCPRLSGVTEEKAKLEKRIHENHPRVEVFYNKINNKSEQYFKDFLRLYNNKCAYCGVKIGILDIRLVEIDHYICKSSFSNDKSGRIQAGKVSNLILACYSCNHNKGSYLIKSTHRSLLNPDDGSIANVFQRNEDYYICVCEKYAHDRDVMLFYNTLMLGGQEKRLDYLLLEMFHLANRMKGHREDLSIRLEQCFGLLLRKRNATFTFLKKEERN